MTIRKSIRVERSPEVSFRVFCEEIGQWWPKGRSFGDKQLVNMIIEGRIGGRLYEIHSDGSEYEIGRVTAYQPPRVVAFSWRAPSWEMATQVEVRFIPDGGGARGCAALAVLFDCAHLAADDRRGVQPDSGQAAGPARG